MVRQSYHPSDQQLLLAADGELSARRAAQVRSHLAACWNCRARMAEIEEVITDFARIHRLTLDPPLPPISGARERLKSQLAQLSAELHSNSSRRSFRIGPAARVAAYVGMAIFITAVVGNSLIHYFGIRPQSSALLAFEPAALPNPSLTPGAVRQAAISEVCVTAHEEVVKSVPAALREKVFQEYGIVHANPNDYEIDYLIAPGLGGREDIRNLWPQPRASLKWNSEVKDALEEHLHRLVCSGQLDLSTAQRDIAANWIAAYKRYFQTDQPLPLISDRRGLVGAFIASSRVIEGR
jgi:hypothetical protein